MSSEVLVQAAAAIRGGGIVGVPTDTVYGLAVDPLQVDAVRSLFDLKGRPREKPIGLLGSAIDQFEAIVDVTAAAHELAGEHWPGPLTLVVEIRVSLPDWVGDHNRHTVAIRIPDHDVARDLFTSTGPLAVTSANLSGHPPAVNHEEARTMFGDAVHVYLPGTCPGGTASTVADVTVDPLQVLRPGPIKLEVRGLKFEV